MMPNILRTAVIAAGALALAALSTFDLRAQQGALAHEPLALREQIAALRDAWNERLPYVPGEVLIRFRDGVDTAGPTRALASARTPVTPRNARWIGDALWLRADGERDAPLLAGRLARQPEVLWAQPNYVRSAKARPNDPSYPRQWNFDLIEMPRAWDINDGSNAEIVVAVVDSGITTVTRSFSFPLWTGSQIEMRAIPFRVNPDIGAARILPGRDFVFWNGPVLDMVGHGTHVAATVLEETNNNLALAGIAHRAKLLPLKVCIGYWEIQFLTSAAGIPGYVDPEEGGGCPDSAVAQAIRFAADSGAQVINVSLGGEGAAPIYRDAIAHAVGRGAFVAMAMGNEFEDGNPTGYPAAYAPEFEGAMSVGAIGRSSRRAFYSSTGAHLEIVAPGGDSRDGGLNGVIYQTSLLEDDFDPFTVIVPRFDRYVEWPSQGTSMASPHVAGVAALLYSQGINRPAAIEAALKRFARDLGNVGRDDDFGHGLIDARAALRGLGIAK